MDKGHARGKGCQFEGEMPSCILNMMPVAAMVINKEGKILSFNHFAEDVTGYSQDEVLGENYSILNDVGNMSLSRNESQDPVFPETPIFNQMGQIKNKDGKTLKILKNWLTLKGPSGHILGAIQTITDITALLSNQVSDSHEYQLMALIGKSKAMQKVFQLIKEVADSSVPVIITGESGTGKELVADAIQKLGKRKDSPFVKVNCASLNESLLDSELFGHRKGAFTGAIHDHPGRFETAHKGTLLLDEIESMPLSMQGKLLRVLEEHMVIRVGDNHPRKVDVRIISATNKDLASLVESGEFRKDLYYRVNVFPIAIPPLRERLDDLPFLVDSFLKKITFINHKNIDEISPIAMKVFRTLDWPGNVRELINALEYAVITCQDGMIDVQHLPDYLLSNPDHQGMGGKDKDNERVKLMAILKLNNYNRNHTAEALGISRVSLWKKMKKWNLL